LDEWHSGPLAETVPTTVTVGTDATGKLVDWLARWMTTGHPFGSAFARRESGTRAIKAPNPELVESKTPDG